MICVFMLKGRRYETPRSHTHFKGLCPATKDEAGRCCLKPEVTLACSYASLGPAAEGQSPASHRASGEHLPYIQPESALGEDRDGLKGPPK